ncbi:MAG: hypothetical protein U9R25_11345 [Chloroflexota bacterium]|nr:hypothetical protein [Chloroflexota bacterium]
MLESLIALIPPSLVLSTLLTLIWATAWFVLQGGTGWDWLLDILTATLGFAGGQLLGRLVQLPLPAVGEVHVIEGTVLCLLALIVLRRRSSR